MNPRYEKTQAEIKERIQRYLAKSKLSSEEISCNILGKAAKYMSNNASTDRVIGMVTLQCIAQVVPMPKRLMDAALVEDKYRNKTRGRRVHIAHSPEPWRATVEKFMEERPIIHKKWSAA